MTNTPVALPIATAGPIGAATSTNGLTQPVGNATATNGLTQPASQSTASWLQILKQIQGGHHHHGGAHGTGMNNIQSSTDWGTDAFGVSVASNDTSVDSFGTPSANHRLQIS